jgi:2-polyprenyl-3-methyl-5-hydroxy-6-metoxy-1,4-benzoquinol methylase
MQRIAAIFDDRTRPETTGGYCLQALRELTHVDHVHPSDLPSVPQGAFDLYLCIDDGLRYRLPTGLHPSALWTIDTHVDFAWCLERAHDFDLVFAAQRDGALALRDEGISAHWLPLACDPSIHRRHDRPKVRDICFVGNIFPGPRSELLDLIRRRYPDTFVGQAYFEVMARTYSESRVVFNRSIRNDVNMRVFEAVAAGSLLLTNDLRENGQEELLSSGTHLVTYGTAEDMLDKLAYYLRNPAERQRIAQAGQEEVMSRHTYRLRMEAILQEAEKHVASHKAVAAIKSDQPLCFDRSPEPEINSQSGLAGRVDRFYYGFARPEVVALVPPSAQRVLDIGCGTGRLGEAIKARQRAEVIGVELIDEAACEAKNRLDQVLVGDIEQMEMPFAADSFDAVICADVLEHLTDPECLLRRVHDWLRPGGVMVASIPNVRHHSMIQCLLEGNWTAEAAGILDHTHLQFFTRRSIKVLLESSGLSVDRIDFIPGPGYDEWRQSENVERDRIGRLDVRGLAIEKAEELFAYQFLVTATRRSAVEKPSDCGRPSPSCALDAVVMPRRVTIVTRSMNEKLYELSGSTLASLGCSRQRYTGTDSFGYFRALLGIDVDWAINIDEDAFLLAPDRLTALVRFMESEGYAACGMPDGGVVPIRRHNPLACNAFFNVFDMRRVRPIWQDWDRVRGAGPPAENARPAPDVAQKSVRCFDHFERYYSAFFALLAAGERILYLDAEEWSDGVSTLLKDHAGMPLLVHSWYTRYWDSSHHTRQRMLAAANFARSVQGLSPALECAIGSNA